jgi:hypothetical protein
MAKKKNKKSTKHKVDPNFITPISYYASGGYLPYEEMGMSQDTQSAIGMATGGAEGMTTGLTDIIDNNSDSEEASFVADNIGAITNTGQYITSKAAEEIGTQDKDAATWSGAVSGLGEGAAIGSAFGPWGALIGAVVGGAYGAYSGSEEYQSASPMRKAAGADRVAQLENPIQYMGAYGGELPMLAYGGPKDKGKKKKGQEETVSPYAKYYKKRTGGTDKFLQKEFFADHPMPMADEYKDYVFSRNRKWEDLSSQEQLVANWMSADPYEFDVNSGSWIASSVRGTGSAGTRHGHGEGGDPIHYRPQFDPTAEYVGGASAPNPFAGLNDPNRMNTSEVSLPKGAVDINLHYRQATEENAMIPKAYGGQLPQLALGGVTIDPPRKEGTPYVNAQGHTVIDAPKGYYEAWQTQFGSAMPQGSTLSEAQYKQWIDQGQVSGWSAPEGGDFVPKNPNPPAPAKPKGPPRMLDANTGRPLDPNEHPVAEGQQINRQYSQYLEQFANSQAQRDKRAATEKTRQDNIDMLGTMTDEQKMAARSANMTPVEYMKTQGSGGVDITQMRAYGGELAMGGEATEYNGNRHEDGGIQIGNSEVEDGEIRVGDYVFSDRLTTVDGKTFADAAKKIVGDFEEYQNDGASMRTQNKKLQELSFLNDQARLVQQKEDAERELALSQGYMAYGGMIRKDKKGKYVVDSKNRKAILDAAKANKMSYNKYVDEVYCYGGRMKKKLADGGRIGDPNLANPYVNTDVDMSLPINENAFDMYQGSVAERLKRYLQTTGQNASTQFEKSAGQVTEDFNRNPYDMTGRNAYDNMELPINTISTFNDPVVDPKDNTTTEKGKGKKKKEEGKDRKIGNEELALLASNLPAFHNLLNSMGDSTTSLPRVDMGKVNLNAEREAIRKAIDQAENQQRHNVRGTASSAGEALAGLSAGMAGLASKEMSALGEVGRRESAINEQRHAQQVMTNAQIAMQEGDLRQQDDAMKATMKSMGLSDIGGNIQAYMKDLDMKEKEKIYNDQVLSLLETGEYKIVEDGKGGFKVEYTGKKTQADRKAEEELKDNK